MLNAALAVTRFKRLFGFYLDLEHELNSCYTIDGNHMLNEQRVVGMDEDEAEEKAA